METCLLKTSSPIRKYPVLGIFESVSVRLRNAYILFVIYRQRFWEVSKNCFNWYGFWLVYLIFENALYPFLIRHVYIYLEVTFFIRVQCSLEQFSVPAESPYQPEHRQPQHIRVARVAYLHTFQILQLCQLRLLENINDDLAYARELLETT